jgi:hypothetical protein
MQRSDRVPFADLLRQSVYSRLAGYEDLNDAQGSPFQLLRVALFLTCDSAACTADATVRREQHQEMISVLLRCSREKCHAFPGHRKHDTARKHFPARTNLT